MTLPSGYVAVMGETKRLNVQAILFIVAFVVMIMFGLFLAISPFTFEHSWMWQDAFSNGSINGGSGVDMLLVSLATELDSFPVSFRVCPCFVIGILPLLSHIFTVFLFVLFGLLKCLCFGLVFWFLFQCLSISSILRSLSSFSVSCSDFFYMCLSICPLFNFPLLVGTFFAIRIMPILSVIIYPKIIYGLNFFATGTLFHFRLQTKTPRRLGGAGVEAATNKPLRGRLIITDMRLNKKSANWLKLLRPCNYTRFGVILQ